MKERRYKMIVVCEFTDENFGHQSNAGVGSIVAEYAAHTHKDEFNKSFSTHPGTKGQGVESINQAFFVEKVSI
jgi:hypothetical protein